MSKNISVVDQKIAAEEITHDSETAKFQLFKPTFGPTDTDDGPVSLIKPMPVSAAARTDVIQNGATQLTPKFKLINETATGDNEIVAAVSGKKIRVLSYVVTGDVAGTFRWESPAGTPISGLMVMTAVGISNGCVEASFNPCGHFETTSGGALSVEMTTASDLQGHLTYILV